MYILLMSMVMNFALGVDIMLLKRILGVSSPAVLVQTLPSYSKRSPLAVIRVWASSAFSGRKSKQIRVYMAIFPAGIMRLSIQKHVFVPLTHCVPSAFLPMPWNSRPNSLAPDVVQTSLNFGVFNEMSVF